MVNSAKPSFFDLFWFLLCRTCQEKKFRAFTSCPPTKSQRRREKQGAWTAFAMCPARKLCRSSREPQGPPGQSSLLASASRPPPHTQQQTSLSPRRLPAVSGGHVSGPWFHGPGKPFLNTATPAWPRTHGSHALS